MFEPGKPIISLTDAAAEQVRRLIATADGEIAGLRIGIKTAGCSGLQYDVQYAAEAKPFEDKIEDKGGDRLHRPQCGHVPCRVRNGLGRG